MDNQDLMRQAADRGRRMGELSDLLFEAFDAIERNYLETMLRSDPTEAALRDGIYHRVNALRDVRKTMELVIAEGQGAEAMIAKLSKRIA